MEQLKTISTLIVALATAAIVSMVAYSVTEDVQQAIVITMAWWAIKNSS